MFKKVNEEDLMKRNIKDIGSGKLNKVRILDSLPLKKLSDSLSLHSSVASQSRLSSVRHMPNNSIMSS